ncbi:ABC transporter ATP-binding protein [Dolichospermum sp. UHCC 0259]|uniref:ATP-binding cassette domain-containing protein n=1 Tax=Dolichospermum sp. UHCC 0259 TaxID=2590010 RepID=UPI001447E7C0|nr:ABC transporter ATP-binding protein [Dolichospermum sp. UHCC 0259]MTJ47594.1 ABC transporter ATP-binding protein [Dolichospermum sp. UHCC 0259]
MVTIKKRNHWKLIWQLICYKPKLYILDSIYWILITGLPALPGLIIREFFNSLTNKAKLGLSPLALIALLLALNLGHIVIIFAGRVTKTQHRFLMRSLLQHNLLDQLFQNPTAQPIVVNQNSEKPVSQGEIISYFRDDTEQIEDNIAWISELSGEGIFGIFCLVTLLSINVQMTLFVFLPLVGMIAIIQQAETRIKKYRKASRQATEKVTGILGEIFGSVQAIKVAGVEKNVLDYFRTLNDQRRQTMIKDSLFNAILKSSFQNMVNLGTGIILLLASQLMQSGVNQLTVGDFALFVYNLSFVTGFFTSVGGFMALSKQTEVSFERMASLLSGASADTLVAPNQLYLNDLNGSQKDLPKIEQPLRNQKDHLQSLKVSHLTYIYPGTNKGITDISFEIQRGSLAVITGQIGSGKSTLLRLLLGLLPKQSGEIYWNGNIVENPATFFVPPRSAYTPQIPQLFSYSLRENILLGLSKDDQDIAAALNMAVFEQDLATMNGSLETLVGSKGVRLSGGQIQRVAAARMFIRQPELMVFDDLSSALDVETELALWSQIFVNTEQRENAWRPTCLVVSHRPSVFRCADQIIVMKAGRVEAQGKFDDIFQ